MKAHRLVSGVSVVALVGLSACTSSPGTADPFSAHQYKYVPTTPESNASTPPPFIAKSHVEVRPREESVAVFRRPDPPPPRPPSDVGRPRPPKPSK